MNALIAERREAEQQRRVAAEAERRRAEAERRAELRKAELDRAEAARRERDAKAQANVASTLNQAAERRRQADLAADLERKRLELQKTLGATSPPSMATPSASSQARQAAPTSVNADQPWAALAKDKFQLQPPDMQKEQRKISIAPPAEPIAPHALSTFMCNVDGRSVPCPSYGSSKDEIARKEQEAAQIAAKQKVDEQKAAAETFAKWQDAELAARKKSEAIAAANATHVERKPYDECESLYTLQGLGSKYGECRGMGPVCTKGQKVRYCKTGYVLGVFKEDVGCSEWTPETAETYCQNDPQAQGHGQARPER